MLYWTQSKEEVSAMIAPWTFHKLCANASEKTPLGDVERGAPTGASGGNIFATVASTTFSFSKTVVTAVVRGLWNLWEKLVDGWKQRSPKVKIGVVAVALAVLVAGVTAIAVTSSHTGSGKPGPSPSPPPPAPPSPPPWPPGAAPAPPPPSPPPACVWECTEHTDAEAAQAQAHADAACASELSRGARGCRTTSAPEHYTNSTVRSCPAGTDLTNNKCDDWTEWEDDSGWVDWDSYSEGLEWDVDPIEEGGDHGPYGGGGDSSILRGTVWAPGGQFEGNGLCEDGVPGLIGANRDVLHYYLYLGGDTSAGQDCTNWRLDPVSIDGLDSGRVLTPDGSIEGRCALLYTPCARGRDCEDCGRGLSFGDNDGGFQHGGRRRRALSAQHDGEDHRIDMLDGVYRLMQAGKITGMRMPRAFGRALAHYDPETRSVTAAAVPASAALLEHVPLAPPAWRQEPGRRMSEPSSVWSCACA